MNESSQLTTKIHQHLQQHSTRGVNDRHAIFNRRLHKRWIAELETLRSVLPTKGIDHKTMEATNEGFQRLAERIDKLPSRAHLVRPKNRS